ncbi:hypothetical protein ACTXT7_002583 [Hymenolepis weldensis]
MDKWPRYRHYSVRLNAAQYRCSCLNLRTLSEVSSIPVRSRIFYSQLGSKKVTLPLLRKFGSPKTHLINPITTVDVLENLGKDSRWIPTPNLMDEQLVDDQCKRPYQSHLFHKL